jgi:mRNA interferase MazF
MRDRHPFLVLSERAFNDRTSLVIGLPMSTAHYNADNPFAVPVGSARVAGRTKASYVLCHQPKSFDWRVRHAAVHPLRRLADPVFAEVCAILNQIVRLA